jgi:hypothetical protein
MMALSGDRAGFTSQFDPIIRGLRGGGRDQFQLRPEISRGEIFIG